MFRASICFVLLCMLQCGYAVAAPVKGEMLLFQEIPVVSTASMHAVSLLDSPATASIITREDIEHMGFLNVPELLLYVTGVSFYKTGGSPSVGIRGVNGMPPNNILVLVDGRPIYSPARNTNQCAIIPETPSDIEKVEIVRGPGSVLYGSHAFAGVINIITRRPEEIDGIVFSAGAGTFSAGKYSVTGGRRSGPFSYKLLGTWDQKSSEFRHDNQVRGLLKFAGSMAYDFSAFDSASLSFGIANGSIQIPLSTAVNSFDQNGIDGFVRGMLKLDDMKFDLWWRHHDSSSDNVQFFSDLSWKYDNFDLLASSVFRWHMHEVVYGAEFRFATLGAVSYDGWHNQYIGSMFFEDRWHMVHGLNLFAGMRYDYHSEAGGGFAPRLSLVKRISDNQSVRLVFARAFKFPSYYDNYGYLDMGFIIEQGDRGLDPEQLTSFEAAWQVMNIGGLSCTASLFYNSYKDKIDSDYRENEGVMFVESANMYDFDQYGFELEASYRFPFGLFLKGSYSHVWNNMPEEMISGPAPVNQFNGEVRYKHSSGWWVDFRFHWQDASLYSIGLPLWAEENGSYEASVMSDLGSVYGWQKLNAYATGDLSMGYSPDWLPWTFSLGIHNIFHERYEMSQYHNLADTTISGRITYTFR